MSESKSGLQPRFGANGMPSGQGATSDRNWPPKYQIKIKISEGHKRVFYLRDDEEASDIMFFLERAASIYSPRR
jgi:hypothetical protein